jgi:23S rRNA pseudouridine1911/1915/1917 synthase
MDKFQIVVDGANKNDRLDAFLAAKLPGHSRSSVQKLIEHNHISVNGHEARSNYRLKTGDSIKVEIHKPETIPVKAENIPLDIVYEDDTLLVVNKPAGMVVHPAPGNYSGTLVNALLYHCDNLSGINGVLRPGIVHRIDKDTTGLIMVAKDEETHRHLAGQLKEHSINRKYIALVRGAIEEDEGTIQAPIGRHPTNRKKMAVTARNSREATTHFSVINRYAEYTLIEARLETGRTHQIRVHMNYIGHPVVGDPKYGREGELDAKSLLLHAAVLGFVHPARNKYMEFNAPLPGHFLETIRSLQDFPDGDTY